mmetsp:Transcript_33968/g.107973  ORF Transcript_33968/g.107973 Transcript_33968/m.107973 type:complete len:252 (+) Transcript_33968:155-910(+)
MDGAALDEAPGFSLTGALRNLCCSRPRPEPPGGGDAGGNCNGSAAAPQLLSQTPAVFNAGRPLAEPAAAALACGAPAAPGAEQERGPGPKDVHAAAAVPPVAPWPPAAAGQRGEGSPLCGSGWPAQGDAPGPAGSACPPCGGGWLGGTAAPDGGDDSLLSLDSFLGTKCPPRKSTKTVVVAPAAVPEPPPLLGSFLDPQQPWPGQDGGALDGGGRIPGGPLPARGTQSQLLGQAPSWLEWGRRQSSVLWKP